MHCRFIAVLVCVGGVVFRADAHELQTHRDITAAAADRSVLSLSPNVLKDLGIDKNFDDNAQQFPNSKNKKGSILDLLQDGSAFEDTITLVPPRVTKHFYNPVTGKGMDEGAFRNQPSSPDWALAPRGSDSRQQFSYWDARQYFYDALTGEKRVDRERSFGLTFQTLGHVMHHLQDMTQPQHVRNDVHCHALACLAAGLDRKPSLFEDWTEERDTRLALPMDPASVGYDITGSPFTSTFNSPRRFWHTETPGVNSPANGKGIAEFTNRNFVSAGTNFDQPQLPSPPFFELPAFDASNKTEPTVLELCGTLTDPKVNPPCPELLVSNFSKHKLTFYGTNGHDNFLGGPSPNLPNPRASTESIFDQYLQAQDGTRVFALNRFNFAQAHKQLMPRAVAFSAGMINYFFRGKIDIDADPNNPGGYLIKNLGAETMSGKFALYYDAIDATDATRKIVPDENGLPLVWDSKLILADAGKQLAPNGGVMPVSGFKAPQDAKTPGEYLLVFKGDMGEEKADEANGVTGAVAAKLVSAPGANGTLYILARNNLNRLQTLKVDKTGTASATDFDPFGASGDVSSGNVMFKQVAFKQAVGGGWSYQVQAGGFTSTGANPGFFWDEASKTFVTHALRRWTAQSPNPAIGKFFFWFTQSSSGFLLNYTREFIDASGVKQTATGTVPLPVLPNLSFFLSLQIANGGLAVSEDGLHISDFLGSSATTKTPPDALNVYDTVTEKKYYELLITLSETPAVELNLLRTLRDTSSTATIFKPNSSTPLSVSETFHFEEQRFIGYFNRRKELYSVTADAADSGSGEFTSIAPCLEPFANWQSSFVRTDQFSEGALVYTETCDNSAGTQRTGGNVFRALTYRSDDAIYDTHVPNNNTQLNFRNVAMTPRTIDFVAESSPIGEIFFAKPDLSVIIHEPRAGGMKKIVLPPTVVRILGAIWL